MTKFDSRVLLLSPSDNCLIAATNLPAGTALDIEGETVVLAAKPMPVVSL